MITRTAAKTIVIKSMPRSHGVTVDELLGRCSCSEAEARTAMQTLIESGDITVDRDMRLHLAPKLGGHERSRAHAVGERSLLVWCELEEREDSAGRFVTYRDEWLVSRGISGRTRALAVSHGDVIRVRFPDGSTQYDTVAIRGSDQHKLPGIMLRGLWIPLTDLRVTSDLPQESAPESSRSARPPAQRTRPPAQRKPAAKRKSNTREKKQ